MAPHLQGGKEATRSNALLHKLIVDAIAEVAPAVGRDLIGLVTSRGEIDQLLKLHDVIDLVIPRGSNQLVRLPPPAAPSVARCAMLCTVLAVFLACIPAPPPAPRPPLPLRCAALPCPCPCLPCR